MKYFFTLFFLSPLFFASVGYAATFERTVPCVIYDKDLSKNKTTYANELSVLLKISPDTADSKDIAIACVKKEILGHGKRVCESTEFQWLRNQDKETKDRTDVRFQDQRTLWEVSCEKTSAIEFTGYRCTQSLKVYCY